MQEEKLLDILAEERIHNALNSALAASEDYQDTLEQQERADDEVEQLGLNKEQKKAVGRLVAAVNANGAAYGTVAYRQGLKDGVSLISELKDIAQSDLLLRYGENVKLR